MEGARGIEMFKKLVLYYFIFSLLFFSIPMGGHAVSTTTTHVILYLDKKDAYVNLQPIQLEAPPVALNGRTYLPTNFLSDILDVQVEWIPESKSIIMVTNYSYIEIDLKEERLNNNGLKLPFDDYINMENGHTYVQLNWIAEKIGALYTYDPHERKIEITHLQFPGDANVRDTSTPVAKFTFGKQQYRIGEPVKLIDLSYDPDGEGLTKKWIDNEKVYFKPGTYSVTLIVTDRSGRISEPYTKNITITDDVFLTEQLYPLYYQKEKTSFQTNLNFLSYKQIANEMTYDFTRKLLVSDSPEMIIEKGILYQDHINGKGRLYANHVNGMKENVTFAILATNNTDEDIKITTTNSGEVLPTPLVNLMGHIASVDYLLDENPDSFNLVKSNQTIFYKLYPNFLPQYGINSFYDIETDGELTFTFIAMKDADLNGFEEGDYHYLAYDKHVRGTFPASDIYIEANKGEESFTEPYRLSIGDEGFFPFIHGYDYLEQERESTNIGNYGMTYHITIDNPGKVAVLLRPRGGPFKGPVKINEELVIVPSSGMLTPLSGVYLLQRTTNLGREPLEIELTPPAGSAFPVDLIFYPLEDIY